MKLRRHRSSPDERLARLADGSIGEGERADLERAVAASPELAAKLAEQRRALAIVSAVEVELPAGLVEGLASTAEPPSRRARRRVPLRGVLVVGGAMLVLALLAGTRNQIVDVRSEVHLALAQATLEAPPRSAANRSVLAAAVDGIAFPDWQDRGWRAAGARTDSVGGNTVETVFYSSAGYGRIGYSIVAGPPLSVGVAQRVLHSGGVSYAVLSAAGATVVTWQRDGHTCILASQRAPAVALLALAGWA
jgi:hypothetical protein